MKNIVVAQYMPVISALGKLKQGNYKFEINLDCIVRPCHKKTKKNTVMKHTS
jgi:hypothetical protein